MLDKQLAFDQWCKDHTFSIRGERPARDWHIDTISDYNGNLLDWDGESPPQHVYSIYAGTGSGKTECAGNLACLARNQKRIRWIVYICPRDTIVGQTIDTFKERFGFDLVEFSSRSHRSGPPSTSDGYVTTYQAIASDPALHRRIIDEDWLVILDEVHHLGESSPWGKSAIEAFGRSRHVITLTGTPFRRPEDAIIPFLEYEEAGPGGLVRFKPNVTYSLGRAVADGICRKPVFDFHNGVAKIGLPNEAGYRIISLEDTLKGAESEYLAGLRLRGIVAHGSTDRREMLHKAFSLILPANRKTGIFLGGDSGSSITAQEDAMYLLPQELCDLGLGITMDDIEIVTSQTEDARERIRNFAKSGKKILITIQMFSEGVDIPCVSAIILLTSITAKQTTIQRIGRALRYMGHGDFKDAWIFLFKDRFLREIADEIENEIKEEVQRSTIRKERAARASDEENRTRAMSIGIGDGRLIEIVSGGESYTPEEFDAIQNEIRELEDMEVPSTWVPELLALKMRRNRRAAS